MKNVLWSPGERAKQCWSVSNELRAISLLKLFTGDKLCKQLPAVVRVKCSAEGLVDVLD